MSFELSAPLPNEETLNFTVAFGEVVFVLGANGTGKSSLLQRFYAAHHGKARRISAHRQTWFQSNAMTMSAQKKKSTESSISSEDNSPHSRWMDNHSAQRASVAIYDLIDAENVRARGIAEAVDADNIDLARLLCNPPPKAVCRDLLISFKSIPYVMRYSHFPH